MRPREQHLQKLRRGSLVEGSGLSWCGGRDCGLGGVLSAQLPEGLSPY